MMKFSLLTVAAVAQLPTFEEIQAANVIDVNNTAFHSSGGVWHCKPEFLTEDADGDMPAENLKFATACASTGMRSGCGGSTAGTKDGKPYSGSWCWMVDVRTGEYVLGSDGKYDWAFCTVGAADAGCKEMTPEERFSNLETAVTGGTKAPKRLATDDEDADADADDADADASTEAPADASSDATDNADGTESEKPADDKADGNADENAGDADAGDEGEGEDGKAFASGLATVAVSAIVCSMF